MSGSFQTSRDIFSNPIWKNIVEFRLFFLIYGQAVFSDEGVRLAEDLTLRRGEWCRSTRKLQEDLTYIENRQIKTYSTSVINRCIKKLEKDGRIQTRIHDLGTIFTVYNYDEYQLFSNYRMQVTCNSDADDLHIGRTRMGQLGTHLRDSEALLPKGLDGHTTDNMERNLEQYQNSVGTVEEQSRNNNKNVKKDKNVKKEENKKHYAEFVSMSEEEYQKLLTEHGESFTQRCITILDNYKGATKKKYASDYRAILTWVVNRANEDISKENRHQSPVRDRTKTGRPTMAVVASDSVGKVLSQDEREKLRELAKKLDAS